jgi:Protein of unknown function (DUF3562)
MLATDQRDTESPPFDAAVEALAKMTGAELARVHQLYNRELARLEATAKVRSFLAVIASRNVRDALRQR